MQSKGAGCPPRTPLSRSRAFALLLLVLGDGEQHVAIGAGIAESLLVFAGEREVDAIRVHESDQPRLGNAILQGPLDLADGQSLRSRRGQIRRDFGCLPSRY